VYATTLSFLCQELFFLFFKNLPKLFCFFEKNPPFIASSALFYLQNQSIFPKRSCMFSKGAQKHFRKDSSFFQKPLDFSKES
jgi:hypothetical protein